MTAFFGDQKEIEFDGRKLTLNRESRWSRTWLSPDGSFAYTESRFMDGSARITLDELEVAWASWTDLEKLDFCQNFGWVRGALLAKLARFVMNRGDSPTWSACALVIANAVPSEEAKNFFVRACESALPGHLANLMRSLVLVTRAAAIPVLHDCLRRIESSLDCRDERDATRIGIDAVCCLKELLDLGDDPQKYRVLRDALVSHRSPHVRTFASGRLHRYYPTDSGHAA